MLKIKLGVIGAGVFTDFSLLAYQAHHLPLEYYAIADAKVDMAKSLAQKFHFQQVYSKSDGIINNSAIQLIIILTPPNQHFVLANKALKRGKHILVEKPIAFNKKDALKLITIAKKRNLHITANLVLRHHPFHQQIHQFVLNKRYGQLRQISTTALLAKYPRDHWYWDESVSGGFFLNTYCHFFDLYKYISGEKAVNLGHIGKVEQGQVIYLQFPQLTASLAVNVNVENAQEKVISIYVFDRATIMTEGWFPHRLTINTTDLKPQTMTLTNKLANYKKALASVMTDHIKTIKDPYNTPIIQMEDLYSSVTDSTQASKNSLR